MLVLFFNLFTKHMVILNSMRSYSQIWIYLIFITIPKILFFLIFTIFKNIYQLTLIFLWSIVTHLPSRYEKALSYQSSQIGFELGSLAMEGRGPKQISPSLLVMLAFYFLLKKTRFELTCFLIWGFAMVVSYQLCVCFCRLEVHHTYWLFLQESLYIIM